MGKQSNRKKIRREIIDQVTIEKSELTNNFLININGFCYDSAINYDDALLLKTYVETRLKQHPIQIPNQAILNQWIINFCQDAPVFDAEIIRLDLNDYSHETIMFSQSLSENKPKLILQI